MTTHRPMAKILLLVAATLPTLPILAAPPRVIADNGNLWLTDAQGHRVQLTASGQDRAPVLSPDGSAVAFLRKSVNRADHPAYDFDDGDPNGLADQLWIVDIKTKSARLLVPDRPADAEKSVTENCQRAITYIDDDSLCFSPDGDRLHFLTAAWVTSGALHRVDLKTGAESFVMAANSVEVVPTGDYRGHLIVNQHRCHLGGGSYDWYWLFTPDGTQVAAVGESREQVAEFLAVYTKPAEQPSVGDGGKIRR